MKTIKVASAPDYEIVITNGSLETIYKKFGILNANKVFVLTDTNVAPHYLSELLSTLGKCGFETAHKIIPAGEEYKKPATYLEVIDAIAEAGLNRKDAVVALGGGVVSDIAGFAAATYMRGIDFVACPTTVLAAIDAAVGGKTGVDLPQGKNLLGAFKAPRLVAVSTKTFGTLPDKEIENGLGEAVKYAVLKGGEVLDVCSKEAFRNDPEKFVALNVAVKAEIVGRDFTEKGERKLLNLGHTFAHVAEKLSNYTLSHGVAVAKGLSLVAEYAVRTGKMEEAQKKQIDALIMQCGIDPEMGYGVEEMLPHMGWDKKMESPTEVALVVPYAIGDVRIEKTVLKKIAEVLS